MKMYILTRCDIGINVTPSYIAVQSAHAAVGVCMDNPGHPIISEWYGKHLTMILLAVKDEDELLFWKRRLDEEGIVNHMFIEPDIGDRPTSLACCPRVDQEDIFSSLKLLKISPAPAAVAIR